jgi:hypothetical protein
VSGKDLAELDRKIGQLLIEGPGLEANVLAQRLNAEVFVLAPNELTELSADVLELLLIQARARTESITLVPIELTSDDAFEIARVNRRDWMNARANLVDTWRLIQFNANLLESGLDLVFSGDVSNTGDNPLRLDGNTGRLQVGVQFDAPLTRLSERNTYRLAQIEYQQARRNYYEFVDRVAQGLRETIRTIDLNQLNFELRRAAVQVAIAQVELARLRLQEPPKPEVEAVFGPTTANDLVNALSALLTTQNDFLSVWINYEVQRRTLDFDLGTMQLDADGTWLDPGPIEISNGFTSQPPGNDHVEPIAPGEPPEFLGPPQSQSIPPHPSRNLHLEFDRHASTADTTVRGEGRLNPSPNVPAGYVEPSARRGANEPLFV